MKKYILVGLIFCINLFGFAQSSLSPNAQVSLITFAPGKELHAAFGHAVIWVSDPVNGIDKAYSYGTFDFNTENFYFKFLKGTLAYSISFNAMPDLLNYYSQIENRTVSAQTLRLTLNQKNEIFTALETNLLPENRNYSYKFFYDNCSSRLRDILEHAAPSYFHWNTYKSLEGLSYRAWMNQYLNTNSWVALGMNLALGIPANSTANASQSCYLPDNLSLIIQKAEYKGQKLADSPLVLYQASSEEKAGFDLLGPLPILIFLCLVVIWFSLKSSNIFLLDVFLFTFYGFLAWFLFFLAVGTDHGVMAWNSSLLTLFPLNFPLVFWFAKSSNPKKIYYIRFALGFSLIGMCLGFFQFPLLALAGLPIAIRLFFLARLNRV